MSKKVFYDEDARRRVLEGARILYEAVKTTMGPKGRNVVISKAYGAPTVTHDGVTVAKGVDIADVDDETLGYKVGAELIKQAANKMNDVAGDGTTTVTVLTYHILSEANKLIAAGHNPMLLRKGLEAAAQDIIKKLDSVKEDIAGDSKRVAEVATISAGDAEIGKLIADVIEKVGKDGVVTVEEGQGLALESEVVEGFTFDRGFLSPYMVSDTARMEAVIDKPHIIVTEKKISSLQEFLPVLEKIAQTGKKEILIIAEDIEGEALATLVLNKLKGVLNVVAVKAPSFGDRRKDILQDIAILTGGTYIDADQPFENVDLSDIGSARKVIVTKDETTIIEGAGSVAEVTNRIAQITTQIANTTSEYDKENYEKRRAALNGKVAVIKVGGATETEIEEEKFRVDDAVAAVKAALDEGIVPGGGVTLINVSSAIKSDDKNDPTIEAGKKLLVNALEQPFRVLMTNAGLNADEWLPQVKKAKVGQGVNVNDPTKLVDLKATGVVDPARVTKEAVQNASSIAGTAITMGALVVDVPEAEPVAAGGMGGGMPGMGMM
ncbi:chaperonin GroEL [Candidatus Saccharibacteria bacterium]|nr:chaperonin GroEL [Candidatus Saccharibacteria bacterium]